MVPPDTFTAADPSLTPLQLTLPVLLAVAVCADALDTVAVVLFVHPLPSVTVTV